MDRNGEYSTTPGGLLLSGLASIPVRSRRFLGLVATVGVAIYLLSGIYAVQPDELGVVFRYGRVVAEGVQPGIHYHLPAPFERVARPKTAEIKKILIGAEAERVAGFSEAQGVRTLTGDTNVLLVQVIIQYVISDPVRYLLRTEDPTLFIQAAAEGALTTVIASAGVDGLLTTEKLRIQSIIKDGVQERLDSYGVGVQVTGAYFQEIRPPVEVAYAFREVASAREDKARMINDAEGYRNVALPITRGEAQRMANEAESYSKERVERAKGEADRFLALLGEYEKSRDVTAGRVYLEKMEKILSGLKVFIMDKQNGKAVSNLRLFLPETDAGLPAPVEMPEP